MDWFVLEDAFKQMTKRNEHACRKFDGCLICISHVSEQSCKSLRQTIVLSFFTLSNLSKSLFETPMIYTFRIPEDSDLNL